MTRCPGSTLESTSTSRKPGNDEMIALQPVLDTLHFARESTSALICILEEWEVKVPENLSNACVHVEIFDLLSYCLLRSHECGVYSSRQDFNET